VGQDNPAAQGDGKATGTLETGKGGYKALTTRRGAVAVNIFHVVGRCAPVLFLSALMGGTVCF